MNISPVTAICAVVPLLVAATARASDEATGEHEDTWNHSRLLEWVSGIGDEESPFDQLDSVKSFERLQQSIEEVKQLVLHDARTEQEAVEGLRMILKHLASSTNDAVNADLKNPLIAKRDPRNRDIGAYNPDAEYDQARIDGRYDYKLTGNLGTVPYVSITVNGTSPGKLSHVVAYLNDPAIRQHAEPNGNFTLWLTKQKPKARGAWVELPDTADGVVIRQYVADRSQNTLARFAIEAVGDRLPDVETTTDSEIAGLLAKTASYLLVSSTWHRTLLPQMRETPNQFVSSDAAAIGASAANSENYYQMAYYELGDGEALVIDLDPPDTVYWNLTSATIWHESHRYLTDPVTMTSSEARYEKDGSVRFVLARTDPGHPNWIKTFGHERGFLIFRMVGVTNHALPITKRLPLSDVNATPASGVR